MDLMGMFKGLITPGGLRGRGEYRIRHSREEAGMCSWSGAQVLFTNCTNTGPCHPSGQPCGEQLLHHVLWIITLQVISQMFSLRGILKATDSSQEGTMRGTMGGGGGGKRAPGGDSSSAEVAMSPSPSHSSHPSPPPALQGKKPLATLKNSQI